MRILLFIFLISFCSCSNRPNKGVQLSPKIKVFSTYYFSEGKWSADSVRATVFLFKGDSLFKMTRNSEYSKTGLTSLQIDSINLLLSKIDFEKLIETNSLIFDTVNVGNNPMYCGPAFGFIDAQDSVGAYKPIRDARHLSSGTLSLFDYLFSITTQPTTEKTEMRKYAIRIAEKHIRTATPPPKMEEVEFVPPVIADDPVIETD
ncbi:MAG: hypothetical protein AB7P01_00530 [Bacteroidia bacterium]